MKHLIEGLQLLLAPLDLVLGKCIRVMSAVQTADDKLDESRAALERKSRLYERLAAGQFSDDDDLYNVDFMRKGTLEEEKQSLQHETPHQSISEAPIDTAAGLLSSAGEHPSGLPHYKMRFQIMRKRHRCACPHHTPCETWYS